MTGEQQEREMWDVIRFDRFLHERMEEGETEAAVLAKFPALSRAWQDWKRRALEAVA